MSVTRLPTELQVIVFELVCSADMDSDGHNYRTASSLCLVSRFFYSTVVPIMYRTLLLDGRTKASLLSRTLQCKPELGRSAQQLFLSDHARCPRCPADDLTLELPPAFAFEYPGSREGRVERLQRMDAWLAERSQTLSVFHCAVHHILDVVSPQLQTLSICMYGHYDGNTGSGLADALTRSFPLLVELTVRDNVQPFLRPGFELPALQRLNLAGGNSPFPFVALREFADNCPSLTHIRISDPFMDDSAVTALELLFSDDTKQHSRSERRSKKHTDTLQHLVLKSNFLCENLSQKHTYERLVALSTRSDVFKIVSPLAIPDRGGPKRDIRYPLEALRDWMDNVMARPG